MDIFDWEELAAEMLGVTDEQRENEDHLPTVFEQRYGINFDNAYDMVTDLIHHTPIVEAGLTKKQYHAFVSKDAPVMLMKIEAL